MRAHPLNAWSCKQGRGVLCGGLTLRLRRSPRFREVAIQLYLHLAPSPLGNLLLAHDNAAVLRTLDFEGFEARMDSLMRRRFGPDVVIRSEAAPRKTLDAIDDYFAGRLDALAQIGVMPAGTPFQEAVWKALRTIRPGRTATYGEIARLILRPKAVRAVGAANGANPIALVVPCHRVIGASGALTGFAGGMARKNWLLVHEGVLPRRLPGFAGG